MPDGDDDDDDDLSGLHLSLFCSDISLFYILYY